MEDLKNKIEALLFSSGKAMSVDEIRKICRLNDSEPVIAALKDLKVDYDNRESSLMLINEADTWKITTKEDYFHVVKKVVSETELSKSLMETLAVIAWKYPIKQCDLIKVRTNKAYAHLDQLEQMGYISRQKHGRTKLIKLTDKFFSYFDLPPEKLKEKFSDFNQIAQAISGKEQEIEKMKEEHKKLVEEAKKSQDSEEQKKKEELDKEEKEIDLLDKSGHKVKLEQYESEQTQEPVKEETKIETYKQEKEESPEKINSEEEQDKKQELKEEKSEVEEETKDKEENSAEESSEEETNQNPYDFESETDKKAEELVKRLMNKDNKEEEN